MCAHRRFGDCDNCKMDKHDAQGEALRAVVKRNHRKINHLTAKELDHLRGTPDAKNILRSRRLDDGTFEVEMK